MARRRVTGRDWNPGRIRLPGRTVRPQGRIRTRTGRIHLPGHTVRPRGHIPAPLDPIRLRGRTAPPPGPIRLLHGAIPRLPVPSPPLIPRAPAIEGNASGKIFVCSVNPAGRRPGPAGIFFLLRKSGDWFIRTTQAFKADLKGMRGAGSLSDTLRVRRESRWSLIRRIDAFALLRIQLRLAG